MKNKDKRLEIDLKDEVITISIGIETLAYMVTNHSEYYSRQFNPEGFIKKVVDKQEFAEEIVCALNEELSDDGTTMVHQLFDKAILLAAENGAIGLEYKEKK